MSGPILNVLDLYEYTRPHLKYTHQSNGTTVLEAVLIVKYIALYGIPTNYKTLELKSCADCEVCHRVSEVTQGMVLL